MAGRKSTKAACEPVSEDEIKYKEAVKWFKKAANQGYAPAQYMLGKCYDVGNGVRRSGEEAAKWYQKAAEQGHAKAQKNWGTITKTGIVRKKQ